ncbi:c-type cytochrome biogenesis protein CcsB [Jatrophihabitans sp.]|uniref:c-type cytochrome biogenesis protein CcsB n=1 Tax=Jatrophihabitans sp. TaxID=1932789 RepID=UPI002C0833EA|nr:c-type cytochrome biogenesis protein CcsB [Jatrophihabitans sp.]
MAINAGLASLSESLWTAATGTYMLAVVAYTGEYAFGKNGRIARTSTDRTAQASGVRQPALVGSSEATGGIADRLDGMADQPDLASQPRFGAGTVEPAGDAGRRWGRAAVGFTVLAALFHLASVAIRGIAVDRVPWGNMYEFTLVVGLMATVAWLATLVKMPQLRYLGLFVMMPVLLVMFLAGTLYTKASKLVPALQSYWLAIHVSSVAVAEGILLTSAAITTMYLVRARFERHAAAGTAPARFAALGSRLPAAAALDKAAYRTVAFAFPIYTAGVIFGAIWAEAAWGRYWGWDPKETWAFIAWVIYAMYLHARATAGWKGNRAAYINLLGFGAMTFNFFVVNIVISGLHSYAGLS